MVVACLEANFEKPIRVSGHIRIQELPNTKDLVRIKIPNEKDRERERKTQRKKEKFKNEKIKRETGREKSDIKTEKRRSKYINGSK